jgi:hypothetical protein
MSRNLSTPVRCLVVLLPALILGWILSSVIPKDFDVLQDLNCLLWLLVAVSFVFLFRRDSGWPGLLIVIGSIGFALNLVETRFATYAMHSWIPAESAFWQQFLLWDNVNGIVMLCFPVGLVLYIYGLIRRA